MLTALFELEGRLTSGCWARRPPARITVRELVFGLSYSHIVNSGSLTPSRSKPFQGPDEDVVCRILVGNRGIEARFISRKNFGRSIGKKRRLPLCRL